MQTTLKYRVFANVAMVMAWGFTALGQVSGTSSVAGEWVSLIDGAELEGWVKLGGRAKYGMRDGAIVGTTVPGSPNTFLCTKKHYGDFVLELEYKVHPDLNGGIQIRSHSLPEFRNGVVHGYQVEIDPSPRAWSGGIYDESRRGWINNLRDNEPARKAFRQNQWNHYRIEAIGDRIRTWINGVPAADLRDTMTLSGFIGLQVHGTGRRDPMEIVWRNIRIKELGRHEWRPMFDGNTLDGWSPKPGGEWQVENGVIRGTSQRSVRQHGLLVSDDSYDQFTVRLHFRINQGDSGFYFRSDPVDSAVGIHGFQVELDTSYETGGLYETGGRGWVIKHPADKKTKWYRVGQWNELTVSAWDNRTVVHMNGHQTAELKDDPGRTEGHFALQLHGGQDMDVEFRNIERLVPVD